MMRNKQITICPELEVGKCKRCGRVGMELGNGLCCYCWDRIIDYSYDHKGKGAMERCPICGEVDYVTRRGVTGGRQSYYCKDCNHRFFKAR